MILKELISKNKQISRAIKATTDEYDPQYSHIIRSKRTVLARLLTCICIVPNSLLFCLRECFCCHLFCLKLFLRRIFNFLKQIFAIIIFIKRNFLNCLIVVLGLVYITLCTDAAYKSTCFYNATQAKCTAVKSPVPRIIDLEEFFFPEVANTLSINRIYEFNTVIEAEKNTTKRTLDIFRSLEIFYSEMSQFKSALDRVYLELKDSYKMCSYKFVIQNNFSGFLDADLILEKANLSNLVQFYDNRKIKYTWLHSLYSQDAKPSATTLNDRNATSDSLKFNCSLLLNSPNMSELERFKLISSESLRMCSNDSKAVAGVTQKKSLVSVVGDEHIEINDEYWSLWNSNNMSMLNISRENYGHDGSRIELGNASQVRLWSYFKR